MSFFLIQKAYSKLYLKIFFFLGQKSLPLLDEEIKKQISVIGKELNKIKGGPPQEPQGAKQYLIKVIIFTKTIITSLSCYTEPQKNEEAISKLFFSYKGYVFR